MLRSQIEGLLLRFRRIFLISLAPLLGLSALAAIIAAGPVSSNEPKSNTLTRLLRSVVTPIAEASALNVAPERPSPQAVLPFAALSETPLRHSLWMVASVAVAAWIARRPQRNLLRC
jgi:hypothetical protein